MKLQDKRYALVLLALMPLGWCGCDKKGAKAKPNAGSGTIDAADLWEKYHTDQDAADKAYKGKELVVSGKVQKVGKQGAFWFVVLYHPKNEDMSVRSYFLPADAEELEPLAENMPVKIKGECLGKIGPYVTLKPCHIQK